MDVGDTFSGVKCLSSIISGYILIIAIILLIAYWVFSVVQEKNNTQNSKVRHDVVSEAKVVESIINIDSEFTLETFKTQVSDTYITLQ